MQHIYIYGYILTKQFIHTLTISLQKHELSFLFSKLKKTYRFALLSIKHYLNMFYLQNAIQLNFQKINVINVSLLYTV